MSSTYVETAQTAASSFPRQRVQVFGLLVRALARAFDHVYAWQARAQQRAHLAALDDRLLKDAGITRVQVALEVAKPFWRE